MRPPSAARIQPSSPSSSSRISFLALLIVFTFIAVFSVLFIVIFTKDLSAPSVTSIVYGAWFYVSPWWNTLSTNASNIDIPADFDNYIPGTHNALQQEASTGVNSAVAPIAGLWFTSVDQLSQYAAVGLSADAGLMIYLRDSLEYARNATCPSSKKAQAMRFKVAPSNACFSYQVGINVDYPQAGLHVVGGILGDTLSGAAEGVTCASSDICSTLSQYNLRLMYLEGNESLILLMDLNYVTLNTSQDINGFKNFTNATTQFQGILFSDGTGTGLLTLGSLNVTGATYLNTVQFSSASGASLTVSGQTSTGTLNVTSTLIDSTSPVTGTLLTYSLGVSDTTDASSANNGGSATFGGGASVKKTFYVGNNAYVGNNLIVQGSSVDSTSSLTGTLTTYSLGVSDSTDASSSTNGGGATFGGGASIRKTLYVGLSVNAGVNVNAGSNLTVGSYALFEGGLVGSNPTSGTAVFLGDVGVNGTEYVQTDVVCNCGTSTPVRTLCEINSNISYILTELGLQEGNDSYYVTTNVDSQVISSSKIVQKAWTWTAPTPQLVFQPSANTYSFSVPAPGQNSAISFPDPGTTSTVNVILAQASSSQYIATSLRVGSAVAPTAALDVTGTVKVSNTAIFAGAVQMTESIDSTSTSTGTLVVVGGVGVSESLWANLGSFNSIQLIDSSNQIVYQPGSSNTLTINIVPPATAAIVISIPDVSAVTTTADFVLDYGTQTLQGSYTFGQAIKLTAPSNQIAVQPGGTGHTYTLDFSTPGQDSVITYPDPGTSAANVLLSAVSGGTQSTSAQLVMSAGVVSSSTSTGTLIISNGGGAAISGALYTGSVVSSGQGTFTTILLTGTVVQNQISVQPSGSGNTYGLNFLSPGQNSQVQFPDPGTTSTVNVILSSVAATSQTITSDLALSKNLTVSGNTLLPDIAESFVLGGYGGDGQQLRFRVRGTPNPNGWLAAIGGATSDVLVIGTGSTNATSTLLSLNANNKDMTLNSQMYIQSNGDNTRFGSEIAPTHTVDITGSLGASAQVVFSGTTTSTSSATGILLVDGGVGISCSTDATSSTNGGCITNGGGLANAKSMYVGTTLTVGASSNAGVFYGTMVTDGGAGVAGFSSGVSDILGIGYLGTNGQVILQSVPHTGSGTSNMYLQALGGNLAVGSSTVPTHGLELTGTLYVSGASTLASALSITTTTNQILFGTTNVVTMSVAAPTSSYTITLNSCGGSCNFITSASASSSQTITSALVVDGTLTVGSGTGAAAFYSTMQTDGGAGAAAISAGGTYDIFAIGSTGGNSMILQMVPSSGSGTSNMYLQGIGGNVAIGSTTTPTHLLEVSGTVKATGTVTLGASSSQMSVQPGGSGNAYTFTAPSNPGQAVTIQLQDPGTSTTVSLMTSVMPVTLITGTSSVPSITNSGTFFAIHMGVSAYNITLPAASACVGCYWSFLVTLHNTGGTGIVPSSGTLNGFVVQGASSSGSSNNAAGMIQFTSTARNGDRVDVVSVDNIYIVHGWAGSAGGITLT